MVAIENTKAPEDVVPDYGGRWPCRVCTIENQI